METIHVTFDELLQTMAPVHISSGPKPMSMMSVQISSGLALFLKEKKGVRFSTLYLQKKRNLLVFDHSHQQIRWQKRIFLHLNLQEEMNRSFIARSGYRLERETFSWIYRSCRRILSSAFQLIFRISVALAGPNPEHMHDVFLATNYPKVHESLKHTTKEHVHLENPPSSSRTLSSMKNLEDNFTFGDQVINDKSQEDELGKTTVERKVESMVIVPIQQASSSAPPLNTLVIDLSSPSQN
ncbi:hypothetical protein Tco_1141014 [Tanacetum coccineum]